MGVVKTGCSPPIFILGHPQARLSSRPPTLPGGYAADGDEASVNTQVNTNTAPVPNLSPRRPPWTARPGRRPRPPGHPVFRRVRDLGLSLLAVTACDPAP